jgi:hypothetical protein
LLTNDHLLAMVSSSQPAPNSKVFDEFKAHGIRPTTYAFAAYDCAEIVIDSIGRAIQANGGKLGRSRSPRLVPRNAGSLAFHGNAP